MIVRFHPDAEIEFFEAALWYSNQMENLDEEFVDAVDRGIERIQSNPRQFPIIFDNFRKLVIKKFPFVIIYTEEDQEILVLAVFHTSKNPKTWNKRISI